MAYSLDLSMRILRALQALFSVIALSLSASVAYWYDSHLQVRSPTQVNFLIFASIFSMLSVGFLELGPKFMARVAHPFVLLAIGTVNVIFCLSGFIAWSVFLGRLVFCRGSVCGAARADNVFSSLLFVSWTITVVLLAKDVFGGGFRRGGGAAGITGPSAPSAMKEFVFGF